MLDHLAEDLQEVDFFFNDICVELLKVVESIELISELFHDLQVRITYKILDFLVTKLKMYMLVNKFFLLLYKFWKRYVQMRSC